MSQESQRISAIFEAFRAANPHPQTELHSGNAYQLLVAVVLSAQATDKGVNKATESLFKTVFTPRDMVELGEEGLAPYIRSINLNRTKGKNIVALSRLLEERHGGQVPSVREELEALPGVGRKTANVILNAAFGQPTLAVDTHVFRVAHRLGLADAPTPEKVEQQLLQTIPTGFLHDAHHWLILHGRYTCTAKNPKCASCPVEKWCPSSQAIPGSR